MPIKEIMDKIFSAYKFSLVAVSLISIMLLSAATVQSQTIEEQQPASDPVSDYMDAIDNIEAEYSAYSTELSDLYLGLGKSLYSRQEYEKARQAFQRGMQIQRINYGLNSLSQGPYLLSIADAESFLGNWDESQEALENLYRLMAPMMYGCCQYWIRCWTGIWTAMTSAPPRAVTPI
jgi:tetratricopeptide (TPR) repeat protein